MGEPRTLVCEEMAIDRQAWTAVDLDTPGIALIETGRWIGVLLARNVAVERDGTRLSAVRWVRIPQGWRLRALRLLASIRTMRLPDEWLFNQVFLTLAANGMFIARLSGDARRPLVLPAPSEQPYPLKPLTAGQYRKLVSAHGRRLHAELASLFPDELDARSARAHDPEPAWPVGPLPWRVFAGE